MSAPIEVLIEQAKRHGDVPEAHTEGPCLACGQPEQWRSSAGWCGDCHNAYYLYGKAERKKQLAAMARCECCSCRGTWNVGGVLLCGSCKKKANAQLMTLGFFTGMLAAEGGRETVLAMVRRYNEAAVERKKLKKSCL